jgi:Protein of unknown function (DUF2695)
MAETTSSSEIMTPDNPRWSEFFFKLEEAVSQMGSSGDGTQLDDTGKIAPQNPDRPTHWLSRKAPTEKRCDVEASLADFRAHGGYCDCEVLFNVENNAEWPLPTRERMP